MTNTARAETTKPPIAYYPEIRTLADAPRVHGRDRPNHRVFHFEGRDTTYADFERHTAQIANGLLAAGVNGASRVVYLGKNSDYYFELLYGTARAGAVLAPVNWRLAEPEVVYITNDTEAEILFVDGACASMVERILPKLPLVRTVVAMEPGTPWESFEAWRDRQSPADPNIVVARSDVALQLYTSGTTGRPKGVQLTHASFSAFNEYAGENPGAFGPEMDWNDWCAEDVSLVAMPVFHISGSGWGIVGVYSGAFTVVLREFDNAAVIETVRKFRVSKTVLVPTTIQMMLDHPGRQPGDFASMTDFLYGASPIPLDLLERAVKAFKCGFVQLYGMTETCGAVTYLPREDHDVGNPRMRSAGKTIPGAEIRIMDPESDEIFPPGKTGEIVIKAPGTMVGYWKQDDETARVIQSDGWVRSGDAGYMDEDGYVFIQDRVKDMIVSGGENIYPAEVENAMRLHPDVADVAVIAVPDPKWGEAVKGIVVLKAGATADAQALLDFTRTQVAGYKVPKSIDFIDALPRSATGKVLKKDLRAPYWAGQDRQVN
jgi:acyl-CoA synthetase (AMP-forming)/AMP-acid ligase II